MAEVNGQRSSRVPLLMPKGTLIKPLIRCLVQSIVEYVCLQLTARIRPGNRLSLDCVKLRNQGIRNNSSTVTCRITVAQPTHCH